MIVNGRPIIWHFVRISATYGYWSVQNPEWAIIAPIVDENRTSVLRTTFNCALFIWADVLCLSRIRHVFVTCPSCIRVCQSYITYLPRFYLSRIRHVAVLYSSYICRISVPVSGLYLSRFRHAPITYLSCIHSICTWYLSYIHHVSTAFPPGT